MNIRHYYLISFFIPSIALSAPYFVDIDASSPKLLKMHEMRFCYITFVEVDGKQFLVKQKKPLNKLLGVVRDAITAYIIGENFDIAHKVDIIPAGKKFPGKTRIEWPATIHTIAPGKMIKAQESPYKKMNIKQDTVGFRRDMLPWMAKHPTLTKIVALDTFMCNHDRHRGNLFYDPQNDSFCAIDMDSAFKYNLCGLACKNFTQMIKSGLFPLKSRELKALIEYRNILKKLVKSHMPDETIKMYDYFAEKAGFVEGSPLYTQKIHLELGANRKMIRQSYQDAQELVKILNLIIKRMIKP